jgi:hypothetical protein
VIVYQGPSRLDGAPIVVIATAGSRNRKTGRVVQTWILRADVDPVVASRLGRDASVCGDCPLRHHTGGGCYVPIARAPFMVWRAWKRGSYADGSPKARRVTRALAAGATLRLGSYGDPAAVPLAAWEPLRQLARATVGYTHQWRNLVASPYRPILMASADDAGAAHDAQARGWRTFTVVAPDHTIPPRSIECLSESRGLTCADCRICDGARDRAAQPASVWIDAHGPYRRRLTVIQGVS